MLGAVAAVLHGSGFPIAMLIFGKLTNAFINREATASLVEAVAAPCTPDSQTSDTLLISNFTAFIGDPSCTDVYSYTDVGTNATCSDFTLQDILFLVTGSEKVECLTNDLFIDEVNSLVYIFIGLGLGAFLLGFIQTWFFRLAGEKQVSHKGKPLQ